MNQRFLQSENVMSIEETSSEASTSFRSLCSVVVSGCNVSEFAVALLFPVPGAEIDWNVRSWVVWLTRGLVVSFCVSSVKCLFAPVSWWAIMFCANISSTQKITASNAQNKTSEHFQAKVSPLFQCFLNWRSGPELSDFRLFSDCMKWRTRTQDGARARLRSRLWTRLGQVLRLQLRQICLLRLQCSLLGEQDFHIAARLLFIHREVRVVCIGCSCSGAHLTGNMWQHCDPLLQIVFT